MKRKPRSSSSGYDRDYDKDYDREFDSYAAKDPAPAKKAKTSIFNTISIAVLAGVFVLGIGIGIALSSVTNTGAGKIVTQSDLDTKVPNADVCVQYGASAITMDTRVFVTLNPLNVYVSQPTTRPGCVLRSNNWSLLEQRGLIKQDQVKDCKNRMNTFGFTGRLEDNPQIDCVYQNDVAKNLFLDQPGANGTTPRPENERF